MRELKHENYYYLDYVNWNYRMHSFCSNNIELTIKFVKIF